MASIKSSSRKSFKVAGPLRTVGVKAGTGGVRVSLNGQDVVNVRNQAPAAGPGAGKEQQVEQETDTIRLGRFIAEQTQQGKEQTTNDNEKEDEREIVVGPITPIPTPAPTPIANRPIQAPRPARLGL